MGGRAGLQRAHTSAAHQSTLVAALAAVASVVPSVGSQEEKGRSLFQRVVRTRKAETCDFATGVDARREIASTRDPTRSGTTTATVVSTQPRKGRQTSRTRTSDSAQGGRGAVRADAALRATSARDIVAGHRPMPGDRRILLRGGRSPQTPDPRIFMVSAGAGRHASRRSRLQRPRRRPHRPSNTRRPSLGPRRIQAWRANTHPHPIA